MNFFALNWHSPGAGYRTLTSSCSKQLYPPTSVYSLHSRRITDFHKPIATTLKGQPLDKQFLDSFLRRRLFYTPSFEIYGGVSGLYDYGPPGCALQANIIDIWRKHFILEEDMLEVDCTVLTPHEVLKASGHVDKFSDWMCRDPKTGEIFRADHFVKEVLEQRLETYREARDHKEGVFKGQKKKNNLRSKCQEAVWLDDATVQEYEATLAQIDNFDGDGLGALIKRYDLRNSSTGIQPEPPVAFNLMFVTQIGPRDGLTGYMRPETAQGQFLNFSKLLEFNMQSMPFASASIGKSYRNEISPRAGLLRVREFLMAEIEHFVDPDGGKKHQRFKEVENVELVILDRDTQLSGKTTLRTLTVGKAVNDGVVDNETLGYFLARIHLFFKLIGVDMTKIRFRQHLANEMAHYAYDCWDAELLTSSGWVECVGCADRSAYDLKVHAKKTGAPLLVRQRLETPKVIEEWVLGIEKEKFGPRFKKKARIIGDALQSQSQGQLEMLAKGLKDEGEIIVDVPGVEGGKVKLATDLVNLSWTKRTKNVREFIPNVIEPSFGIGRILYSLIEHNFWSRSADGGDETRCVISFPPAVAPTKVFIVPILSREEFRPLITSLSQKLRSLDLASRVDDSTASIGKRYSRNDELGTPFGITIDFQTLQDGTVTLRERDSMRQVRADEATILEVIRNLVHGNKTWRQVEEELPAFNARDSRSSC